MLHYLWGSGQMGDSSTYSPPFLVSFSADLICGRHFSAQLRKQKFRTRTQTWTAVADCGQLMQMTYTQRISLVIPNSFWTDPPHSPPAIPFPFSQTKANKCELLLVCLKCRSKGWTRRRAASRPVSEWVGAGLFSWGHAAFVLEKPKGRGSKEWRGRVRRASKNT